MASDRPPERSEQETATDAVERRLMDRVREQLEQIAGRSQRAEHGPNESAE
jgi:hypothetical protein